MGVSLARPPRISLGHQWMRIEYASLFDAGPAGTLRQFVRRVCALPQVRTLRLEPPLGRVTVNFQVGPAARAAFLDALAAAVGHAGGGVDEASLPLWLQGQTVTLRRFGAGMSVFEVTETNPGSLRLHHAALAADAALAQRIEAALHTLAGIEQIQTTSGKGMLSVSFQPDAVDALSLVRLAEAQLATPSMALEKLNPGRQKMGYANATLGLAALGEFALPVVLPVCVGMLVLSNLGTLRDAGKQLGKGKLGMPALHSALLGCSLATGQIVAHALMDWSFRAWERRANTVLAEECRTLLQGNLPVPANARIIRSDDVDALVPTAKLQAGELVQLDALAAIPADGRVVAGSALVEETAVCGSRTPMRKSFGDKVFAGSTILAGSIRVEVWQTGPQTRAAQVAGGIIESVRGIASNPALHRQAESIADRTVFPTLAAAGLGYAVGAGGLFTAGAVMHADYATGPNLAVPLESLRGIGLALRSGAVVRKADALHRLAESRFVVLDDHPAWAARHLELQRMEHRLAESEADNLLRYAAGAGLYLGDERCEALVEACSQLGIAVRQPPLISLAAETLSVRQGRHKVVLRDSPGSDESPKPLIVEIDDEAVATLSFHYGNRLCASAAIARLRQQGRDVFVLSSQPGPETAELSRQLGAGLHGGDFSREEKQRFLSGLRRRGVKATYVGNGDIDHSLAKEAHVAVSLGSVSGLADGMADIVVLGNRLDALADVADIAKNQAERIRSTCRQSLLPNLLCVAGGYAGVLNGITSGLVANLGVHNVYRQASQSLRESQRQTIFKRINA